MNLGSFINPGRGVHNQLGFPASLLALLAIYGEKAWAHNFFAFFPFASRMWRRQEDETTAGAAGGCTATVAGQSPGNFEKLLHGFIGACSSAGGQFLLRRERRWIYPGD